MRTDNSDEKVAVKVRVLPNPVTIDNTGYHYSLATKEKEILYVSRLDLLFKRVERLIDTWALLEKDCPDWRFRRKYVRS